MGFYPPFHGGEKQGLYLLYFHATILSFPREGFMPIFKVIIESHVSLEPTGPFILKFAKAYGMSAEESRSWIESRSRVIYEFDTFEEAQKARHFLETIGGAAMVREEGEPAAPVYSTEIFSGPEKTRSAPSAPPSEPCPKCGATLAGLPQKCPACGILIGPYKDAQLRLKQRAAQRTPAIASPTPPPPSYGAYYEEKDATPEKKRISTGLIVALTAAALLLLLLVVSGSIVVKRVRQARIAYKENSREVEEIRTQYRNYQNVSMQVEAKTNLMGIFITQMAHFGEYNSYADNFEDLRWGPEGRHRYSYYLADDSILAPVNPQELPEEIYLEADDHGFQAAAVANLDSDSDLDVWIIDDRKNLRNVMSDL